MLVALISVKEIEEKTQSLIVIINSDSFVGILPPTELLFKNNFSNLLFMQTAVGLVPTS
jgi:hypothetical protein